MDDKAEKIALFRYGLIAPLVLETLPRGEAARYTTLTPPARASSSIRRTAGSSGRRGGEAEVSSLFFYRSGLQLNGLQTLESHRPFPFLAMSRSGSHF
jgi:hypothetical protein